MQVLKQLYGQLIEVLARDYFAENGEKGFRLIQTQQITVEPREYLLEGELWQQGA